MHVTVYITYFYMQHICHQPTTTNNHYNIYHSGYRMLLHAAMSTLLLSVCSIISRFAIYSCICGSPIDVCVCTGNVASVAFVWHDILNWSNTHIHRHAFSMQGTQTHTHTYTKAEADWDRELAIGDPKHRHKTYKHANITYYEGEKLNTNCTISERFTFNGPNI